MEQSDAAAVAQARAGNPDAFRVLVERHSHSVFRLAFRMTGNEHDAEDLVQETFLRAYRQLAKFDGRASFGTWLYRVAANCSLDLIRARKRRQELQVPVDEEGQELEAVAATEDPTPDRLAFSGELNRLLAPALAGMPPDTTVSFFGRDDGRVKTPAKLAAAQSLAQTNDDRYAIAKLQMLRRAGKIRRHRREI